MKDIKARLRSEGVRGKELQQQARLEFNRAAQDRQIALKETRGGGVVPSVRQSGVFVPEEFAAYESFKDAKQGIFSGTKDATRFIQEIDGALSVEAKAKLPGQAGPAEQGVLWRTRDMVK